jgi:Type II secretory pathway, pullulanase PulA and related glycosidases
VGGAHRRPGHPGAARDGSPGRCSPPAAVVRRADAARRGRARRTQQGNNNAYCQDNELTWFDWSSADDELLAFARRLIAFRKQHPVFRRRRFLAGKEASELGWFTFAGTPMTFG